jgi:hypothetical protein
MVLLGGIRCDATVSMSFGEGYSHRNSSACFCSRRHIPQPWHLTFGHSSSLLSRPRMLQTVPLLSVASISDRFVLANFCADTFLSKSKSSSATVLPFGSGTQKNTKAHPMAADPAQKKPLRAPQAQAEGFNW